MRWRQGRESGGGVVDDQLASDCDEGLLQLADAGPAVGVSQLADRRRGAPSLPARSDSVMFWERMAE